MIGRLLRALLYPVRLAARGVAWILGAAYVLAMRVVFWVGLALCLVHFTIADPNTARLLTSGLSDLLQGELHFGRIHASPLLGSFTVIDFRTVDPDGGEVVRAKEVRFNLQRQPMLRWALGLIGGAPSFYLGLDRVRVRGAYTLVDVRHGKPPLATAYQPPPEPVPPGEDDFPVLVEIHHIRLEDNRVTVRLSEGDIELDGLDTRADVRVQDGRFEVRATELHAGAGRLAIRALDTPSPLSDLSVRGVVVDNAAVLIGALGLRLAGMELSGAGRLGLDAPLPISARLRVDSHFDAPLIAATLPVEGTGPIAVVARLEGDLDFPRIEADLYAEDVTLLGLELRQASARASAQRAAKTSDRWELRLPHLKLRSSAGTVRALDGEASMIVAPHLQLQAKGRLLLRRLKLLKLLSALHLLSPGALPEVTLEGAVPFALDLGPEGLRVDPRLNLQVGLGSARTLRLRGGTPLHLSDAESTLHLKGLDVTDPSVALKLSGTLHLHDHTLDLEVAGTVPRLETAAMPFATLPMRGSLEGLEARLTGSLGHPAIALDSAVRGVEIPGLSTLDGRLSVKLTPDGLLRFAPIQLQAGGDELRATGELALLQPQSWAPRRRLRLLIRDGAGAITLPDPRVLLPVAIEGRIQLDAKGLELDLLHPLQAVRGGFRVWGRYLSVDGRKLRRLDLRGEGLGDRLRLTRGELVLSDGGALVLHGELGAGARSRLGVEIRDLPPGTGDITLTLTTADGTATAGADYTASTSQVALCGRRNASTRFNPRSKRTGVFVYNSRPKSTMARPATDSRPAKACTGDSIRARMLVLAATSNSDGSLGHYFHKVASPDGPQDKLILVRLARIPADLDLLDEDLLEDLR